MDKKKVSKPKPKPKPKPKTKPKTKPKVKKLKVQHKGGTTDNIGNTSIGLVTSFASLMEDIFAEIDLIAKTPGELIKTSN
jgi:outer membrane biosynthesis protein TonB